MDILKYRFVHGGGAPQQFDLLCALDEPLLLHQIGDGDQLDLVLLHQIRQFEGETVQGVVTLEGETADAVLTEKIAQQGKHPLFIQGDRQRGLFLGLKPVTKIGEQAGPSPGGDEQQT